MFQAKFEEKIKTHSFVLNDLFFRNHAVYETM
jgi:hypothetical protein